jgi:serine/threonine-protein kinase
MTIAAHDWLALSKLLDTALALPLEQRNTWLESLQGQDAALIATLRGLLARGDLVETGGFLSTLPKLDGDKSSLRAEATAGDEVGPYRLVRSLGAGGMGSVWVAERVDGMLKRRVALKLPHVSGPLAALAERLARERDILAALEHPNIARLYDAGMAADGRPYLALELIEGRPIDEYCREHASGVRNRVLLALQVARAVAFAHAHLVVHRDLKPSNVLVDAEGRVRLLDFGIAKLLDAGETDAKLTQMSGVGLTPQYASPEQVRGGAVTTSSDIYSFGIVLFELLTGTFPYRVHSDCDALALAQAIVSSEPRRPSDAVAARALRRQLRGDLDTIVLKALKKRPDERYATIAELANDLEHWLDGAPVTARPDSFWYRTRKLVARNKLLTAAVAAVVLALGIGLAVALWQAQMLRAEQRTSQAEEQFLENIFRQNSNDQPDPERARQTTVRELLHNGAKEVDESLKDAPASRLRMLGTLAEMHNDLQLWDDAVTLHRKRVALMQQLYGRDDPRVADAMIELSTAMVGSSSNPDRLQVLNEAVALLDRRRDGSSFVRGRLLGELSNYYVDVDIEKARAFAAQSVAVLSQYPPSKDLGESLVMQGWCEYLLHDYAPAERLLQQGLDVVASVRGKQSARLAVLYTYLAEPQFYLQNFAGAERSYRKALQIARAQLGPDSGDAFQGENRLGFFLIRTGRTVEGLALLRHASEGIEKARGIDDPLYVPMIQELYARALADMGSFEESLRYFPRIAQAWKQSQAGPAYIIAILEEQAAAELGAGDLDAAQALIDEAHKLRDSTGSRDWNLNGGVTAQVGVLLARNRADDAERALAELYIPKAWADPKTFVSMNAALLRAEVALARAQTDEARRLASAVRELVVSNPQRSYLKVFEARATLDVGKALHLAGRHAEAAPLLRDAVALYQQLYDGQSSPVLANALVALGDCYVDLGQLDGARALEARATAIHAAAGPLGPQYRGPLAELRARLKAPAARRA